MNTSMLHGSVSVPAINVKTCVSMISNQSHIAM